MKKIIFTLALFMGFVNVCLAQNHLVATLQHEGEYTHFYGVNALSESYNAAADGDIITLSVGNFTFSYDYFDKGVTVRGAGIDNVNRTIISTEIHFCSKDSNRITTIEGIQFVGNTFFNATHDDNGQGQIYFTKCRFDEAHYSAWANPPHLFRLHFTGCLFLNGIYNSTNQPWRYDFTYLNCYINGLYFYYPANNLFDHCYVDISSGSETSNSIFSNSIIYSGEGCQLAESSSASYCLGVSDMEGYDIFEYVPNTETNKSIKDANGLFKTFNPSEGYTLGENFELTEKAQQTYIGGDDSQVGMHGGLAAYSLNLQYPIVTKLKANSHTTKEGMLTIDVEVDGK